MNFTKDNIRELDVIYHVSHAALIRKKDISSLLKDIFDVLQQDLGLAKGTLTLKRGNFLIIEAAKGLTDKEKQRGKYKIGEGITGKVGATTESVLIPDISKEPEFLDRTKTRKFPSKTAFLCVPITHESELIGTLSIDCPTNTYINLKSRLRLLEIVANIIADAVAAHKSNVEENEVLRSENLRLKNELSDKYRPDNIIGNCNRMQVLYGMISQVANSQATVLIRGESGTGKELVARAIHYASSRKNKPFVAVNCAALPENLIESELFGYEKGAFTGANQQRKGRFEIAHGGTLFLDEIGDISIPIQIKLLRAIQEKVIERVGGNSSINTNVRIIAATSKNLEQAISENKFREDLYYRLNVFPLHLPPLRERKTDIVLLADHFLEKYNKLHSKNVKRITTPAINMLNSYHWPGNVRELENCIERAVLLSTNNIINACNLPASLQTAQTSKTSLIQQPGTDFDTLVQSFEKEIIVEGLKNNSGNVAAAARDLKTTKRILHYKINKLELTPKKFSEK